MRQLFLTFLNFIFNLAYILMVIRAFLTYVPHDKEHPVLKLIYDATEPLLSVIKRGLPPTRIGVDASPFITIILLYLLQQIILYILALI
jgi:YggT family protein